MLYFTLFFLFVLVIGFGGFYFGPKWGIAGSAAAVILICIFIYMFMFHIELFL